jgi:hypothetical protein
MSQVACGAGAPAREMLEAKVERANDNAILAAITRPFNVIVAALREIFDESAYARFLDRQRMASTPAAYGEFLRESEIAEARRPRCC